MILRLSRTNYHNFPSHMFELDTVIRLFLHGVPAAGVPYSRCVAAESTLYIIQDSLFHRRSARSRNAWRSRFRSSTVNMIVATQALLEHRSWRLNLVSPCGPACHARFRVNFHFKDGSQLDTYRNCLRSSEFPISPCTDDGPTKCSLSYLAGYLYPFPVFGEQCYYRRTEQTTRSAYFRTIRRIADM